MGVTTNGMNLPARISLCALAATGFTGAAGSKSWPAVAGREPSVQDLHREYRNIFKYGNRNAASHLWSSFIIDRAGQLTTDQFVRLSTGYCAVSGSPVNPNDFNRYGLRLNLVGGPGREPNTKMFGYMHYCCWPCVCDTQDFIWVDTKTIVTRDSGPQGAQFHVAVLGNPCDHEEKLDEPFQQPFERYHNNGMTTLRRDAAEVRCSRPKKSSSGEKDLVGATLSDNGYVIISMFFDAEPSAGPMRTPVQPGQVVKHPVTGKLYQDETSYEARCTDRARNGYNSGMGEIFRKVAAISPVADSEKRRREDRVASCSASGEGPAAPEQNASSVTEEKKPRAELSAVVARAD